MDINLNDLAGFVNHRATWWFREFLKRKERYIGLYTGNQAGKTESVAKSYVMRILGIHPVEEKNMRPWKKVRTYRFASETLPSDSEGGEVRNTQYPAFKRMLPAFLIKKDITHRNSSMVLFDVQGGDDITVEFVSFNQDVQAMAGSQRASCWIDESCSRAFYEEQLPRLLAGDGDLIHTLTPAVSNISWEFEDIFEKAKVFIRTKAVCDRIEARTGKRPPLIDYTDSMEDICVIQSATDDNPKYEMIVEAKNAEVQEMIKEGVHPSITSLEDFQPISPSDYISDFLGTYDDDVVDIRRYGLFRQVSGRIFKDYETPIHLISAARYFPNGVPHGWFHARGIDYHEHVPWHCGMIALSPTNEAFIYGEVVVSPESFVTHEIALKIIEASHTIDGYYKYGMNLIDPLAQKKQSNTGLSTADDLNRIFHICKRDGQGSGGYWQSWDTRSTRGREEIRRRLHNARLVGKPFNNQVVKNGKVEHLPTLWVLDTCPITHQSFKNWRLEDTSQRRLETGDIKETPQQKWSHMNMVWEGIMKDSRFAIHTYSNTAAARSTASQFGRR